MFIGVYTAKVGDTLWAHPRNHLPHITRFVPVVGIGSSAGGIEALSKFFRVLPASSGNAYVVIQHLDPNRRSMLADVLSRMSSVQVTEVTDEPEIKPNRVYVIPPNSTLTIRDGHLHVEKPQEARGLRMPIDAFFRSMAKECCERGIGIIMSGTGADGALGLKEIKAAGGFVLAQDPDEAEQDGMPRSAIATGMVDLVLPVAQMPKELMSFVSHPYVAHGGAREAQDIAPDEAFDQILALLRERRDYDFRAYKTGTLTRRIERRMSINHIDDLNDYLRLLHKSDAEVKDLFHDLFIGVTSFFREPEAWDALAQEVLPHIVRGCVEEGRHVRVWVPGCSTGEEAYTVGMLIREQIRVSVASAECTMQLFGSDVDKIALEKAREGRYPVSIAQDVPPELLARYFTEVEEDHSYRVTKHLREQMVFAQQNLLADPPFSKIDLICCRNLLIYLLPEFHRDVLTLFHFALRPGGFLFLGSAETVGRHQDLFQTISQKWRIYRRIGGHHAHDLTVPIAHLSRRRKRVLNVTSEHTAPEGEPLQHPWQSPGQRSGTNYSARFADWARQILVSRFSPTCVMIDRTGQVLYFSGATHDYLVQPVGIPTRDVYSLAREGLGPKLREAVLSALETSGPIAVEDAVVRRGRDFTQVKFVVTPLAPSDGAEGRLLIAFEDALPAEPRPGSPTAEQQRIEQLKIELDIARSELGAALQRLDSTYEDHRASNEELMSMNEELQSTNEELETSKEELQSLNEELVTVNHQVQHKIEEVEKANDDLSNLLTSTEIATIFLDMQFRIMRFTPAMRKLLNLLPTDLGRPISDFAHQILGEDMTKAAVEVMRSRTPVDHQVRTPTGEWYLRRILPYLRDSSQVDGVVITFTNITNAKKNEEHQRMLIAELDHRVKNTLATVATLASQTLRKSSSLDEFAAAFENRIQALSRAHVLMTQTRWTGAELHDIVSSVVQPFVLDRPNAVKISGPPIVIAPRIAVTLMLILNELSTNAAKYGAFSDGKGHVELRWRREPLQYGPGEAVLVIEWQERDGPPVPANPGSGFGSRFIEHTTQYELGGSTAIQYLPYGIHCEIRLPWSDGLTLKGDDSKQ